MRNATLLAPLLVTSLFWAAPALAAERVQRSFEAAAPPAGVRRVIVDIPAGEVTVRNGTADRILISGTVSREPDGPNSRAKEQRIVDDTSVEILVRNDEATIRRRFGPNAKSWRAQTFTSVAVVIELPPGLHLDVKTRAGEVTIDGRFGDVNVDLRAGEIDLRMPHADVRELRASCRVGEVRTTIGNETTEAEGVFPGRTRYINPAGHAFVNLHTTAGEVRVELTK